MPVCGFNDVAGVCVCSSKMKDSTRVIAETKHSDVNKGSRLSLSSVKIIICKHSSQSVIHVDKFAESACSMSGLVCHESSFVNRPKSQFSLL